MSSWCSLLELMCLVISPVLSQDCIVHWYGCVVVSAMSWMVLVIITVSSKICPMSWTVSVMVASS